MVTLVGDLVDPDAPEPRETIEARVDIGLDAGDDRPDASPGDAHQLGDCRLRALDRQPRHGVVEGPRMPGAMARPGHLGDGRTVLLAVHPRRFGFEVAAELADVEGTPAPPPLAAVIEVGASSAVPAAPLGAFRRAHRDDDLLCLLLESNLLDHGAHQSQQAPPYARVPHPVCLPVPSRQTARKPRKQAGCNRGWGYSGTHGLVRRAKFLVMPHLAHPTDTPI